MYLHWYISAMEMTMDGDVVAPIERSGTGALSSRSARGS